jgi:hypothetical protein
MKLPLVKKKKKKLKLLEKNIKLKENEKNPKGGKLKN